MSLRRRLIIILMCTLSGVWLFSATANYFDSRHEIEQLLDAELAQSAEVLLSLSSHELMEERLSGPTIFSIDEDRIFATATPIHKYAKRLAFQVWLGDSTLALRSKTDPSIPLSQVTQGFSDQTIANMIKAKGIDIARRTVAKYREQLDIPVARLRKEL